MKLDKKKALAVKVLGVGKSRVIFDSTRLDEIKEAITRQDIIDLVKDKAIKIRPIKGRKTKEKRKRRRGPGKIHMKIKNKKGKYVKKIRMIRKYLAILLKNKKITFEEYQKLRIKAKMGEINDKKSIDEAIKLKK